MSSTEQVERERGRRERLVERDCSHNVRELNVVGGDSRFESRRVQVSRMGIEGDMKRGFVELSFEFGLRDRVIIGIAFLCQHGFQSKLRNLKPDMNEKTNPIQNYTVPNKFRIHFGTICSSAKFSRHDWLADRRCFLSGFLRERQFLTSVIRFSARIGTQLTQRHL